MTVTAWGAILGLIVAVVLILKKVQPTYAMIAGAIVGGLVGGAGLGGTVNYMIEGTKGIVSAIVRIVAAGVLVGTLIESGAADKIAEVIMNKLGEKRCLVAMMLATWALTAVGVFGDVACLTVAPIAIVMARKTGYRSLGVLMALVGGVKAGNVMSPNPNTIAAAEGFGVPLTSVMVAGIIPSVTALIVTGLLSRYLATKGSVLQAEESSAAKNGELPSFLAAISGPVVTIVLLLLRPLTGITVDPLIALPVGGIAGMLFMGKIKNICFFVESGLKKMSGVVLLLVGTGCLSGIISNSMLKDVIISAVDAVGLPGFMLAPIAGALMGAATASSTAGTTLGAQIFGPTVMELGVSPLAGAAMTHAGSFVFDGLPHGSFFHVSARAVNMQISERLKLIVFESLNGLAMVAASAIAFGLLKIAG